MADGFFIAFDMAPPFEDGHDIVDGHARIFPEHGQMIQEVGRFLAHFQAQIVRSFTLFSCHGIGVFGGDDDFCPFFADFLADLSMPVCRR